MYEPIDFQAERVDRGQAVIDQYREHYDEGEDDATVLSDLLADLMHFADFVNEDFDRALERGRQHHDWEVEEVT